MNSVLVGMFDTQAAAATAKTRLLAAGFSGTAVSTAGGGSPEITSVSDGAGASPLHHGGIGHFFRSLFGDADDSTTAAHNDTYQEAFRRGSHAVTVTATNEMELDRAEAILNECGAVDIDEKAQQWKSEGWTGASLGASVASAATSVKEGATRALHGVEDGLKSGQRSVQRGGVRVFDRRSDVAGTSATAGIPPGTAGRGDAESANRDPLSGEPGSHPVGTAVGASAGGMAAGAAVGTVAGPVGTVIGAAVGAVVGGLAGKGVAEKIDPTLPPRS